MKRLLALDQEEQSALYNLANTTSAFVPSYHTSFTDSMGRFMYVYGVEESEQIERLVLLGASASFNPSTTG